MNLTVCPKLQIAPLMHSKYSDTEKKKFLFSTTMVDKKKRENEHYLTYQIQVKNSSPNKNSSLKQKFYFKIVNLKVCPKTTQSSINAF